MSHLIDNIKQAGFNTDDYLVCSRMVNDAYATSSMSKGVAESLMMEMFDRVTPTSHDRAANIALRYMIAETVKAHVSGVEFTSEDAVRIADEKTRLFFVNQPWFLPGAHSSIQDTPENIKVIEDVTVGKVEDIKIERTKVGSKTVKPKKGLKQIAAKRIYDANRGKENKVIIELFMSQLDMSKAGATTYLYNMKKAAGDIAEGAKKGRKPKAK